MAVLSPPVNVKRIASGFERTRPGKWHIYRGNACRAACGELMIESVYTTWETSTVERVRAEDICAACWPFEKVDSAARVDDLPLFAEAA